MRFIVVRCSCVAAIALLSLIGVATAQPPDVASPVVTSRVLRQEVQSVRPFVANVSPHRRVVVGSAVDGRVVEFPLKAGEPVAARQRIAQLLTTLVEIDVAAAAAELQLRERELEELKNGSLPAEVALAKASLEAALASREYANTRLARVERLFQSGAGLSEDELEEAASRSRQASALVHRAESELKLIVDGPRAERISQAAARVDVQRQVLEGLTERKNRFSVYSPFDGFVTREFTEKGAWLRQGDPVAEIVELNRVDLEVSVPEGAVRFIALGLAVTVRLEAIPDRIFGGRVERIVPLGDERARAFPVRVLVDNEFQNGTPLLMPGMLARVELPVEPRRDVLVVPKDALKLGGPQPVLARVVDGSVELIAVRTGVSVADLIEVEPFDASVGLSAGDVIVVRGNERLRPGQNVRVTSQLEPSPSAAADEAS
jgi:HlyD family secretion protein